MTGSDLVRCGLSKSSLSKGFALKVALAAVVLTGALDARAQQAEPLATPGKLINAGEVLSGQLNAMRSRAKGKRVNIYQIVSEPRHR